MQLNIDKPHHIFADVVDPKALEQFRSAMAQDFAVSGALMPDVHMGYSLPIGSVVATKDMVVPAWVGYDIGCGMCAMKLLSVDESQVRSHAASIFEGLYKVIPVGNNKNEKPQSFKFADISDPTEKALNIYSERSGHYQMGTLGSGNHFIEIGASTEGEIWIVIHSGSRGVGHGIAEHYMKVASGTGKPTEGHFGLYTSSLEGNNYIRDLDFCLKFALANRKEMMNRAAKVVSNVIPGVKPDWDGLINRNHNHAEKSVDGLWTHRKGATHAEDGMLGVIPGNMRDGSFIVRGKGNHSSLCSSSHGAGRVLSRRQAKDTVSLEDFVDTMTGVTARVENATLDESPFAYKNIFEVMEQQKELVEVITLVKPIINMKG
jgi:tRNA-splicing ligase RtcB